MANRQFNDRYYKKKNASRGALVHRERRIAELEMDLKFERAKYEDRLSQFVKEIEQLKV